MCLMISKNKLKKLINKKFLVYGLGKSGVASVNFLLEKNVYFEIFDDNNNKLVEFLLAFPYLKTLNYVSEFETNYRYGRRRRILYPCL